MAPSLAKKAFMANVQNLDCQNIRMVGKHKKGVIFNLIYQLLLILYFSFLVFVVLETESHVMKDDLEVILIPPSGGC